MVKTKVSRILKFLSLGVFGLLTSCSNAVLLHPKGQVGMDEKSLIITATILMLIVVLPVIFLTLFFAWKYRASNKNATYDPKWAHSKKIEAVVWIVPFIIIIALGTVTWITSHTLDPFRPLESKAKPITIEAVSLDWKWLFIYPDQGVASVNQVAFPVNVPVNFKVTSDTVMNSFFIPQLGSQIYSMAGMQTEVHLIANSAGTYGGIAAQFSGRGFSGMNFKALAVSQKQYEDWIQKAKQSQNKLDQAGYDLLAKPSENHPVEYFSSVKPQLFQDIIKKYMSGALSKAAKSGA